MALSASARLEELHAELLELIAALAAATARDTPDQKQLTTIRWRLSRASRARTRLIETVILPYLRAQGSLADQDNLRVLSAQIGEASAGSSRHIAAWTIDRVLREWNGYRAASAMIRDSMTRRIEAEKATLYPLLRQHPLAANTGTDFPEAGTA